MHLEDPQFPPMLKGHAVKAPAKPFAQACRLAQAGELGAGDVVWSRNAGRAQLAIVLEPEVALERALQMGPLLMVALGDCLGSLCPPKVAVQYRWPGGILLNGSVAGEVRVAAPRVAAERDPRLAGRRRRARHHRTAPGATGMVENLAQRGGRARDHAHRHPAVAGRAFPDAAQRLGGGGVSPRPRPLAVPGGGARGCDLA